MCENSGATSLVQADAQRGTPAILLVHSKGCAHSVQRLAENASVSRRLPVYPIILAQPHTVVMLPIRTRLHAPRGAELRV